MMLLLLVISVILVWLYVKWSRVKRYWAVRGVPHEVPHPLLGSLTHLQKVNTGSWLREMYDRLKSPYIGIWLFWRPGLVVNSPDIARRILIKDFDVFRNRLTGTGVENIDPIGGNNIFTAKGSTWRYIRRRMTPVFTSSKLNTMHDIFSSKSKELAQRIEKDINANKPIEIRSMFVDYTTDIIGTALFGIRSEAILSGTSPLRTITEDFETIGFIRGISICCGFFFPELMKIFRLNFYMKSTMGYFRKVFKEIVSQRGGYIDIIEENNLLDVLRRMKYEADKNDKMMDEDVLIAQAVAFLQGGYDTSATALTFLIYELAYQPEMQEKLYKELQEAKLAFGSKDLDATVLNKLEYLNCLIKEILRKYSPMGWLERVCEKDYQIDDKLTISEGTPIYVNVIAMHHDPVYYPDPDKFDPDRFLPENNDGSRPFMPFGEGPRQCIGIRFGRRTLWYAIAYICLEYEIRPMTGTVKPVRCQANNRAIFLTPGGKHYVKFLLVVLSFLWLFLKWTIVKNFWAERGVPHDPPHPLLGSLTFLQKQNPGVWIRDVYDRFKSPYVGIWLFWRPALIINSAEIAQRVLVKDFDVFRNRLLGSSSSKVDPLGGLNIFMLNEPLWSHVRRPLTSMFTSSRLKALHHLFSVKSKELVQRIENCLKNNKPLELRRLTGEGPLRSISKDFMKFSVLRGFAWCSIFFFPELVEIFRFKMFPKSSADYFRRVFKQIVAQRGGYNGESSVNDFIDILRKMKYEADKNGEAMDEYLLVAQAVIMLQGGFDTTSSAISFLIYELAFNPQVQEKLYKELLDTKEALGDKELDANVLSELVYLNCVIKETLRKYSSMGWLDRICDRDYRIDENLVIPKGTTVCVNAIGMHWDPDIYPDPDKFYPERFLLEKEISKKTFMPFGEGPRSCIGRRFAYRTIWYALSHIMLQYELQPIPGSKRPNDIDADKRGLFLTPGEDFFIRFVPRS